MATLAPAWAPALATPDALAECRARHAPEDPGYVHCLEEALQARSSDSTEPGNKTITKPNNEPIPESLGVEQVREDRDEEILAGIIDATYNSRGLGTFRLENGQVWRETTASPERKRLKPAKRYTARIVRGTLGGYRMHVDGVRWMKTVERLE